MWKRITIRRAVIFGMLAVVIVFGSLYYNQRKSLAANLERVAFVLNVDKVPQSLQVESAYVDNGTEYHIAVACRDVTGRLDYILAGRDWKVIEATPPWDYTSQKDNKGLEFTISREAKWNGEDNVSASVLFDQDGQRFIVEYHAY